MKFTWKIIGLSARKVGENLLSILSVSTSGASLLLNCHVPVLLIQRMSGTCGGKSLCASAKNSRRAICEDKCEISPMSGKEVDGLRG